MTTIDLRHVRTPEEARRVVDQALANVPALCRWCGVPSIRWTPCSCDRAQEEARRIAGADR